jgi:tetratricopeptide (TPR) repeat protein
VQGCQAHSRAGRLKAAEALYRRIVARQEQALSLHNLAVILERLGRIDEALGFYERAVSAAPDDPRMQAAWAGNLRDTRRFPEAEAAGRRTLALAPG